MDRIFNMVRLEQMIQQQFLDFWCQRREHHAFKVWCAEAPPPTASPATAWWLGTWCPQFRLVNQVSLALLKKNRQRMAMALTQPYRSEKICEFWFKVKVVEGNDFCDEFWKIHEALTFNDEIIRVGEQTKRILLNLFGGVARDRATSMGYKLHEDSVRYGAYHVVHFRAEKDWHNHCALWFSWLERRDSWMNNTWHIGNVLLSEGITPTLPVYLATGLTEHEMKKLRKKPSMWSFFEIYTVVTKGMLGLTADVGQNREYWAALDFILGEDIDFCRWFYFFVQIVLSSKIVFKYFGMFSPTYSLQTNCSHFFSRSCSRKWAFTNDNSLSLSEFLISTLTVALWMSWLQFRGVTVCSLFVFVSERVQNRVQLV